MKRRTRPLAQATAATVAASKQLGLFAAEVDAPRLDDDTLRDLGRQFADEMPDKLRSDLARSFCEFVVRQYWQRIHARRGRTLREFAGTLKALKPDAAEAARAVAEGAARLDTERAAYLIGSTYAAMLPAETRAKQGVFYTPPRLAHRLMDAAGAAGVDWKTARVLDPSCGGGAFLGPVAARMVAALQGCNRRVIVRNIANRLRGFELDDFSGWMSQVFLEATLHELLDGAGPDLPKVIDTCDSLEQREPDSFDLVIGNPPYGRVSLSAAQREAFRRGLFGHANLYGVFLDLAVRKVRADGGVVAYVTPTSFLSGEYFKQLRVLLGAEANPVSLDLVHERTGVFEGVQQETLLAVCRRGETSRRPQLSFLEATESDLRVVRGGRIDLDENLQAPWILPRSIDASPLAKKLREMPTRLADWGYKVSTGPLVWNRHKGQLRATKVRGSIPLVWAESIGVDGRFSFRAARRNHLPYFVPGDGDDWLVVTRSCVLLQRTTSKEQARRLIAAELPQDFLDAAGGVTVENHINMLVPLDGAPAVVPAVLAAFLNSEAADRAFRCISGSVAVSAYELESMPLPSTAATQRLSRLLSREAGQAQIERACTELYE